MKEGRAAVRQGSAPPPTTSAPAVLCSADLTSEQTLLCQCSLRVPEQEAVTSVLRQGGLCLEARGDSLGLGECRGIGATRPHSQVGATRRRLLYLFC